MIMRRILSCGTLAKKSDLNINAKKGQPRFWRIGCPFGVPRQGFQEKIFFAPHTRVFLTIAPAKCHFEIPVTVIFHLYF